MTNCNSEGRQSNRISQVSLTENPGITRETNNNAELTQIYSLPCLALNVSFQTIFFFFFLVLAIALLVSSLAAPHAVNLAGPGRAELGKLGSLEARLTSWVR